MKTRPLPLFSRILLFGIASLTTLSATAELNQTNRRVTDIENLFDRLRSHADFLGFRHNPQIAPRAMGSPEATSTHYQGIARSSAPGRPYLFVTRSGMSSGDRGYLLVVKMGSRNTTGERMRSNRYEKSDSVEGTQPPDDDRVVTARVFTGYQHPGGIQLCGDILAVPLEGVIGNGPEGKVVFFDVSDPEDPRLLPVSVESSSKIGIAGLTRLPDGKFLLVTTGGNGDKLKFYRSNRESFLESGFQFTLHDTFDGDDVQNGTWHTGVTSHQSLQLMVQQSESGAQSVYLIAGRNDKDTTPFISGKDYLYLYRVTGWSEGASSISMRQIARRHMHTDSGNSANGETTLVLDDAHSFMTDANANFLAGLCTYVSPTGELLVYAIEHFNWGPRSSVRFVEFRHEQVYREGNPIYEKQVVLNAPEFVAEDSTVTLDAGGSKRLGSVRPWVEIFEDANYNGRSVIMDWADRDKEDFKDLRKLSPPFGFNDKASSVRWFAPLGWRIRLYDGDNYKIEDDEPYLDLHGTGFQSGIRVLSDKPYEFDNESYNGVWHETRVTSMKFIPPAASDDFEPFPLPNEDPDAPATEAADDGWSNPKDHLVYRWRLLDRDMNPVSSEWATLTPVSGSPWLATLKTFTRGVDVLNVELTLLNTPPKSILRPIRFIKANRNPEVSVSLRRIVGNTVTVDVNVADPDSDDEIEVFVDWGDPSPAGMQRGRKGERRFTLTHEYQNPDPATVLESEFRLKIHAEDSAGAVSKFVETAARIRWRANRAPTAGPDTFVRAVRSGFKTRIRSLLANDSEPDGDYFAFTGVNAVFPSGATVVQDGDWILYTPASGSEHLPGGFEYSLRDQFGYNSVGRVIVEIQGSNSQPSLNLVAVRQREEGGVVVEFQGIPQQRYEVFAASAVVGPWLSLGQVTADAAGRVRVEDPRAGDGRFYRTQLLAF